MSNTSVSRVELVKRTQLQKATITNIIKEFLEMGIIYEEGYTRESSGRRTETFRLKVPQLVIVAIRLTRKFYRISLYSLTGVPLEEKKRGISVDGDIRELMQNVIRDTDEMLSRYGSENVLGMCIALPGPYMRLGRENIAVVTGFHNLSQIDVERVFSDYYDFSVLTEHDARLAAFAEWKQMETREGLYENNLVQIQSIGEGVGSGAVIDGRILKGSIGVAGEIGHMGVNFNGPKSGHRNRGAFEYYAGTEACTRYLQEMMYEHPQSCLTESSTYIEIFQAYYDGDALATKVVHKLAWMLGYGIANLAYVLNPNLVIIGPDYPRSDDFVQIVRQTVADLVYPEMNETMHIRYSTIEQDTTLLGGYYYVIAQHLRDNLIVDRICEVVTG